MLKQKFNFDICPYKLYYYVLALKLPALKLPPKFKKKKKKENTFLFFLWLHVIIVMLLRGTNLDEWICDENLVPIPVSSETILLF